MSELEQKKEIIGILLKKYSGSVSGYEKLQRELWASSLEQLQRILNAYRVGVPEEAQQRIADIQTDRQRMAQDRAFLNIFRTSVNDKVAIDNFANREIIRNWVDETKGDSGISVQWYLNLLKETPSLARQLSWQSADVLDPVKRRQAESAQAQEDRETFSAIARELGLAENDANFSLTVSVLGSGFNSYQVQQAISSNALNLAPASPEELAQFSQDAAEERQDFLINASPEELRQAARTETEQRRAQFQHEETQRQIAAREQMDAAYGFTPIPELNQATGEKLDSAYFIKLSNTNISAFKQAIRRWGAANVTARIRGIR
jgi:hypothetical protein